MSFFELRLLITPLAKGVIRSPKSKDIQCNGQKFEDTKGLIRSRKSTKDIQCNGQKLENTKGVIRSRKSKKDIQYFDIHEEVNSLQMCM
jgi:hypothetical protein